MRRRNRMMMIAVVVIIIIIIICILPRYCQAVDDARYFYILSGGCRMIPSNPFCCNYKIPSTFLIRVFRFTAVCHRPHSPAPFWSSYIKLNPSSYPSIISAYGFLSRNTQPTVCALFFFHAHARWGCSGKWLLYAPALQLTKQPVPAVCKLNLV